MSFREVGTLIGSSPHTRGAPPPAVESHLHGGIIPAYAGSTKSRNTGHSRASDHPRIRGEHFAAAGSNFFPAGSSPHTRGARGDSRRQVVGGGIIPAYAGSTVLSER